MEKSGVKNRIGETLLKRILRAHKEGAVFRVFVVMPLLPGFEGEVGGPTGTALRAITHWNYASISRYINKYIKVKETKYMNFLHLTGVRMLS